MKQIFIVNKVAGNGKAKLLLPAIRELFPEAIIRETEYVKHATEIARDFHEPDTIIYSVGGDGTANEVVNGIKDNPVTLSIINAGSGNDFIKSLTDERDPLEILKMEKYNIENEIDTRAKIDIGVATINNEQMYFLNVSAIGGFDTLVGELTNKNKRIKAAFGKFSYGINIVPTLFKFKAPEIEFTIDGESHKEKVTLFAICNGCYYGGSFKISPDSLLNDGYFDIYCVKQIPNITIPFLVPSLLNGTHEKYDFVEHYRAKTIDVQSDTVIPGNIDGQEEQKNIYRFENKKEGIYISTPRPREYIKKIA